MDSARRNLLILIGALLSLGLVMVYSASFVAAEKRFGSPTFFLERHCIYLLAGCIAFAVGALTDYHQLARKWPWLLVFALGLLVMVLVPGLGEKLNGARRWFRFGPLTLQPSEVAKPLLIVGLAGWAISRRDLIGRFGAGFLPGAALAGSAVLLVALEPDLGTAALLVAVLGSILVASGVRLIHVLPALVVAVPAGAICAWSRLGYIQARVAEFLSATPDPLGRGYQVTQALIAQGSGGLMGTGIGQGNAKLLFLPEAHNDFIFALIGEEMGLIGALAVIGCFALLVWHGWQIAQSAPDLLGRLIALGVTLMVGLQAAMNMAVVTRLMPTKGISLPLISYGGSSLVFTLFALGLLLNIAAHRQPTQPIEVTRRPDRDSVAIAVPTRRLTPVNHSAISHACRH
jgi:cell division protein FtsW